ncbi:MAG: hypothetical protein V3S13_02830 [Candidatus Omnitrophota bacterium]
MRIKIALLLAGILFFQNSASLEASTIKEKVVGKTIKTVVRITLLTTNIKKVKKKLVGKLEAIEDGEFKERYARFYELVKDLPPDIKATYEVAPNMTRDQMIKNIESVDKKEIYKIIRSISDKTTTELFEEYLRERDEAKILKKRSDR